MRQRLGITVLCSLSLLANCRWIQEEMRDAKSARPGVGVIVDIRSVESGRDEPPITDDGHRIQALPGTKLCWVTYRIISFENIDESQRKRLEETERRREAAGLLRHSSIDLENCAHARPGAKLRFSYRASRGEIVEFMGGVTVDR